MTKQNTGRRGGFWKGLGLFFVGMLVLTAVLCALLWQALKKYEAGTPAAAMRRYLVQVQQQEYDQLYEASGFTPTEFTGKEEYIAYLKRLYDGQNLRAAPVRGDGKRKSYCRPGRLAGDRKRPLAGAHPSGPGRLV